MTFALAFRHPTSGQLLLGTTALTSRWRNGGVVTPPPAADSTYDPDASVASPALAVTQANAWLADWAGTVPAGKTVDDPRVVEVTGTSASGVTISGIDASGGPRIIIRGTGPYGYNASYPYNPTSGAHINGKLTLSGCNNVEIALFTCKQMTVTGSPDCFIRRNSVHSQWSSTRSVPSVALGIDLDNSPRTVVEKCHVGGFNTTLVSIEANCDDVAIEECYLEQMGDDLIKTRNAGGTWNDLIRRRNWGGRDNISFKHPTDKAQDAHVDFSQDQSGTCNGSIFWGNIIIEGSSLGNGTLGNGMQGCFFSSTTNQSPDAVVEQNIMCHRGANSAATNGGTNDTVRYNTFLFAEWGAHGSTQPGDDPIPGITGTWTTNEYNFCCRKNSSTPDSSGTGGVVFDIGDVFTSPIVPDLSGYATYWEGFPGEQTYIDSMKPVVGSAAHWDFSGQKVGAYERSREIWIDGRHPGNDGWPTAGRFHAEYDPSNTLGSTYTGIFDDNGSNSGASPTSLTISEPLSPVYDADKFGTQLASVPVTVTHDVPDVVVQYRVFEDAAPTTIVVDWTDVTLGSGSSTDFSMSVPEHVNAIRGEVRSKYATGVTATQANKWRAGNNIAPIGQSLADRALKFDIPAGISFTPPADQLWMIWNDTNGSSSAGPQLVTGSSTLGLRRMAAVFAKYGAPGTIIVNGCQSSTGRDQLLDDSKTARDWNASFANPINELRSLGTDICAILEHWFTNEASVRLELERHVAPGYLRQMLDGLGDNGDGTGLQPYVSGAVQVASNDYTPSHFMWDLIGAGGGLLDENRTKWVPWYGASFFAPAGSDGAFSFGDQNKSKIQAALRDMVSGVAMGQVSLNSVPGWSESAAFGGHLALPGGTHVGVDIDGESLVAVYMAHAMMRMLGYLPRAEPEIVDWTFAGDGSYVDVGFSLPHGNNLSTAYIEHAAGAYAGTLEATEWVTPSVLPETSIPELHNVQGFSIVRGGSHSFRDFTANIIDTGTGTGPSRKGTVRLTPSTPFASGTDGFAFGFVEGFHMLTQGDVNSGRPHIHMPLETRPHASGCGYGYPALRLPNTSVIAVRP